MKKRHPRLRPSLWLVLAIGSWVSASIAPLTAAQTIPETDSQTDPQTSPEDHASAVPIEAQAWPPIALDDILNERLERGWHVGVVIGRLESDGTMQFAGFGTCGSEAGAQVVHQTPDADTIFEIGSITKVFTGILLAEAQRLGETTIDTPWSELLPDGVTARESARSGSLRHLATHTSGMPIMPPSLAQDPFASFDAEKLFRFASRFVPREEPGQTFVYSNLATGFLGELLARRAGLSYESLVHERIVGPLNLTDMAITLSDDQNDRFAQPFNGRIPGEALHFDALAPAGALRGSARSLLDFAQANLAAHQEEGVAPPADLAASLRLSHGEHFRIDERQTVGLGWMQLTTDQGLTYWHNGGTGGFRSFVAFQPDTGRAVVVLSNSTTSVDEIGWWLLDPEFPLVELPALPARTVADLSAYVGEYRLTPFVNLTVTLHEINPTHAQNAPQADAPATLAAQITGQTPLEIHPDAENPDRFAYSVVEAVLIFDRDSETGAISGVTLHQDGREMPMSRITDTPDASE